MVLERRERESKKMSLIQVKGLMILDADGKRICCKYYSKDFSVAEKQVCLSSLETVFVTTTTTT